MRCKRTRQSAGGESATRSSSGEVSRRGPPPPPASPLVIVDEEVSYEDLIKAQQVKQLVKEGKMGEDSCAESE